MTHHNPEFNVPWHDDPTYFQDGESVEVYSFGRWYPGHVIKLGRTRVQVWYATGSGQERTKAFAPFRVRPTKPRGVS